MMLRTHTKSVQNMPIMQCKDIREKSWFNV